MSPELQVYTPPFERQIGFNSHLLKSLTPRRSEELVVTSWKNIIPNLSSFRRRYAVLARSDLEASHPADWTLPRAALLLEDCLRIMQQERPDLVLADYRSPEAVLAAEALKIPVMVSIPTVMGPNNPDALRKKLNDERNAQALARLGEMVGGANLAERMEMIFGNPFIPGNGVNLIHTYDEVLPPDYLSDRKPASYLAVGDLLAERYERREGAGESETLFISLGKREIDLVNQKRGDRNELEEFLRIISKKFKDKNLKIILETEGRTILGNYPENWVVTDRFQARDELSPDTVIVTSGDSHSVHYALNRHLPIVVIPFVDSQKLIGDRVEALGVGINLGRDWKLGSQFSADNFAADLAIDFADTVDYILANIRRYKGVYDGLELRADSLFTLLKSEFYSIQRKGNSDQLTPFSLSRGQLVYGTDEARLNLENMAGIRDLHIREGVVFSSLTEDRNALPATIEYYISPFFYGRTIDLANEAGMESYTKMLQAYGIFLNGERDLSNMCLKGLDFFAELYGVKLLVNYFDLKTNYFTAREIVHVLKREDQFRGNVQFYQATDNDWEELPFSDVEQILKGMLENGESLWDIEQTEGQPINWEKRIYLNSVKPVTSEILKRKLSKKLGDDSLILRGIVLSREEDKELLNLEEIVLDCSTGLASVKNNLNESKTPYGLIISTSKGIIERKGINGDAVVVMIMDGNGRTAIGLSDKVQFPNALDAELIGNAFSRAMRQIEST